MLERLRLSALMKDVEKGGDIDVVLAAEAEATIDAIKADALDVSNKLRATIADLQGQLATAKAPRVYDCGSCAIGKGFEQRVAQLEGEKGTLRLGLNALRDSYDELEGRHSDIQDDHARVLGLVRKLPMVEAEYIAEEYVTAKARVSRELWANFDADLLALLNYRATLRPQPAQPAQGDSCQGIDATATKILENN